MMFSLLAHSSYHQHILQGWAAFEIGNLEKAEKHFLEILEHEDDPAIETLDLIDAHNGMGMITLAHRDLFDANRWLQESQYMVERYYHGVLPSRVHWNNDQDRVAMRMLAGLGHVQYANGDTKKAARQYDRLLQIDPHDGLGIGMFREGIKKRKKFEDFMAHGWCTSS